MEEVSQSIQESDCNQEELNKPDNGCEKPKKKIRPIHIIWAVGMWLLMLAAILLLYTKEWSNDQYGEVPFAQVLFHLRVPIEDGDDSMIQNFLLGFWERSKWYALCGALIIGGVPIALNYVHRFLARTMRALMSLIVVAFLYAMIRDSISFFGIEKYIKDQSQVTKIYEDYYADAAQTKITFPENKKNLIYIFCESMETSFTTEETGGALRYNIIPQLTEKIQQCEDFSGDSEELGGAIAAMGTTWTVGAIVAETCGLPISIPVSVNSLGKYEEFLPGATSIGDILQEEGYTQVMMMGSKATFGGRDKFFRQHGDYLLYDYDYAVETGKIPEDYYEFWGFEDAKLFEYAKEELTELAESGEPFNFSMLTVDTHFPNGFECQYCRGTYPSDMLNAICCSDRQLDAFLDWIQEQDFYEDTVVVVAGDHPNMGTVMEQQINDDEYLRKTIFFVMNGQAKNVSNEYRVYTTMDIFPTTLAAMGCTIEGDRLGLGTNLYSGLPTLVEIMGIDTLNAELEKSSRIYDKMILSEK